MNYWKQSAKNIYVAAHRGDSANYPENTMLSFRKALEEGVDQIETDVRVTKDGALVLIHDALVDRTTDGTGAVIDYTLAELKALDAGIKKGEQFKGERIPTLTEFMELVKDHPTLTLDIELKEYPTPGHEEIAYDTADRTLQLLDEYGFTDRVVINTFSGVLQEYIRKKYGSRYRQHVYYPVSHLGSGLTMDPYSYAYCCCMFRSFYSELNMAEKDEFARMAARGVQPWAGAAVKDESGVDLAIENGATLITCNNPGTILALLRQKGYRQETEKE